MIHSKRLFTSCFGLGFLPVAPGTWGSLPSVVVYMVLAGLVDNPWITFIVMMVLAIDFSLTCILFSDEAIKVSGKDPGEVVVDEGAGQAVTFLFVCFLAANCCVVGVAGFLLFRIFDIIKPWPCKRLEKLPGGIGILMDDIMAGIYAGVLLLLIMKFV
jgi:phosphatidylglycerophosphatase A